ncbi:MAG: flagellar hook basal-body protein [Oscillospiraceae bacterium]|nr:flagellar hook basal-body protein [Oscillospiraceae bacterium]
MFLRGFYNSAQAMIVKQRELDAVAQNVANINTAGFRKDRVSLNTFQDELIWVQRRRAVHEGSFQQTFVEESHTFLEQGSLDFTDSRFDLAIWGDVYFNITDRFGNTYNSRTGQFELDNMGYLVLGDSGRVQGISGDIYIGHDDFRVTTEGVIIHSESDEVIDTLLLTYIPSDANVRKVRDNLFAHDGVGTNVIPADANFDIIQGAFERSNVDPNRETTRLMEIQRQFEANSVILRGLDTINSRVADLADMNR